MSKQTQPDTLTLSREDYHHAAVRAILHLIDEALREDRQMTKLELNTALDALAEQGELKKLEKGQLVAYPGKRLKGLAERLVIQVEPTKCRSSLEGLLRLGSSYIKKSYLLKMGWVSDDHDELSADYLQEESSIFANDRTSIGKTRSDVCTGLKFSPNCQKDKPSNLTRRGTRHLYYCDPCLQLLEQVKTGGLHAQQSVGCNNPGAIADCEGHDSIQYELYMGWHLCCACSRHRQRMAETARKRPTEPPANVTPRQVRARTSEALEPAASVTSAPAKAKQPLELAPTADVTSHRVKAKEAEALEPRADVTLRQVRTQMLEPVASSRRPRERTSIVPDSATSSFNVASPAPKVSVRQDVALLRVLQANNISDVSMLERFAAMVRLLQANGISDDSMLEELLHKACQPELSHVCSPTVVNNTDRIRGSLNHNAGNLVEKELEPKLLNKQWDAISEMLRHAVFEFVGAANVNGNRQAELSDAYDQGDLSRLYQSLFGTDPEERYQYQHHKLCKIFHVLWAMLGMIVHSVVYSEEVKIQMLDFDFVDGVDPRLEILAKSIEQEGRASIAIFQRANSAWVSNAAFAQGDIVRVAHDNCVHWVKTLRPHLQVVHGQGSEHRLAYPARERAFQTELEKAIFHVLLMGAHLRNAGGYEFSWYVPETKFDHHTMVPEHEDNGDKVFMTVFPGIVRKNVNGTWKVVCKTRVVCTCPDRVSTVKHRQGPDTEDVLQEDDCIEVASKR